MSDKNRAYNVTRALLIRRGAFDNASAASDLANVGTYGAYIDAGVWLL